jgi:tRNA G18 (ribose-2'-O)-methylase SpoU
VIERVEAPDDPRIADYARIGDARWLRERGLFVAEGRWVFERLLDAPRFPLSSVLLTDAGLRALGHRVSELPVPVWVCRAELLRGITGFDFHRGCLALAHRPLPLSLDECAAGRVLIGLEGVGNPDNVGGLVRVAAAFDAGVLVGPATADPLYRKAVRTSMGAVFSVRWTEIESWPPALEMLRSGGYRVAALTPAPGAVPISDVARRHSGKMILLVGSEGDGLTAATMDAADVRVRIPISPSVDSLNVIVAAGIALHAFSE